jgi:acetyl-CoA acetyltransferase
MRQNGRVAVVGAGLHPFGRFPDKTIEELGREAALEALADAGLAYRDVEAGFLARVTPAGIGAGQRVFGELGLTGIPVTNVELACASASRGVMMAADLVRSGAVEVAMVIGVEKMGRGMLQPAGEKSYQALLGLTMLPALYAMMAQRHMHLYGTKPEYFAQVSVKSHRNAVHNPNAQYRVAISLEEVLNSRMIADPITLYQCCPTSDGASAVVLASERRARQLTTAPVFLTAWAGGTPMFDPDEPGPTEGPTAMLAQKVYAAAGIGPQDVDICQVHDAFTPGEILTIEELGLVPKGEGGRFVWEGGTEITGHLPVNTDGGLLSRGHPMGATGGAMIAEIVRQLRGQAGPRQVAEPKVGLVQNAGIGGVNVLAFHM